MSNPSVKGVSHSPLTVECGGLSLAYRGKHGTGGRTAEGVLGSSAKSGSTAEKQGVSNSTESADPPLISGMSVGEFVVVGRFGSVILGRADELPTRRCVDCDFSKQVRGGFGRIRCRHPVWILQKPNPADRVLRSNDPACTYYACNLKKSREVPND